MLYFPLRFFPSKIVVAQFFYQTSCLWFCLLRTSPFCLFAHQGNFWRHKHRWGSQGGKDSGLLDSLIPSYCSPHTHHESCPAGDDVPCCYYSRQGYSTSWRPCSWATGEQRAWRQCPCHWPRLPDGWCEDPRKPHWDAAWRSHLAGVWWATISPKLSDQILMVLIKTLLTSSRAEMSPKLSD